MIYHLNNDEIFDPAPKLIHWRFLNNIKYQQTRFIHPNIYVQNGCDVIYLNFINEELEENLKTTIQVMKYNLMGTEGEVIINEIVKEVPKNPEN